MGIHALVLWAARHVFVNSEEYKQSWIKRGFDPSKLKILPRGLDTELFHPGRRDSAFFEKFGASNGELRLLYVGRISREKDLDLLADAYRRLRKEGLPVRLFVVGHGPYSEALRNLCPTRFLPVISEAQNWLPHMHRPISLFFPAPPTRSAT
jgi:Glycosyltransferase